MPVVNVKTHAECRLYLMSYQAYAPRTGAAVPTGATASTAIMVPTMPTMPTATSTATSATVLRGLSFSEAQRAALLAMFNQGRICGAAPHHQQKPHHHGAAPQQQKHHHHGAHGARGAGSLPYKRLYKCCIIRQDTRNASAKLEFITWILTREMMMTLFGI